jgi:hypothetical protein
MREVCRDPGQLLPLATQWPFAAYERQGSIHISDIEAPPRSAEKSRLRAGGVRTWLCMPM